MPTPIRAHLILVRHGQSQWNLENRFTGWWDVDLTGQGVAEATAAGETVIVSAHGNSLRALVKHLSGISDADITGLEIPTGEPIVYEFDGEMRAGERHYLKDR